MRFIKIATMALTCAVFSGALLAGCASDEVAATVNGEKIYESQVNEEIVSFRTQNGLLDDQEWQNWLSQNNQTEDEYRNQTLNDLVDEQVIIQAANDNGVTVTDEEVESYLTNAKSAYESEEAWQEALRNSGLTEEEYKANIKNSLLSSALQEVVAGSSEDGGATDEAVIDYFQKNRSYYNGAKRSAHILFAAEDGDKANEVLAKIKSGELTFEEAAAQYSTDAATKDNGGDQGWNVLRAFSDSYEKALDDLKVGEVSEVIDTDFGKEIVTCTEVFTAPKTIKDVSVIPADILEEIKTSVTSNNGSTAFDEWLENYRNSIEIVIVGQEQ